ncbi:cytochrome C [Aquitalea sp. S1-19]|uniref:Cytochrome C n=1 Tax=Craterilacuibacter sinensis TaxID=2686017 RepID=A0A845BKM5_9NEIS|nr:diheme cytochrome c [Craterilacuibacter sinensis]MCP9759957.1 cytochrome C [Aquitalea sp. S1-19]MXR35950.1 cytochrome C [Craterilacuibacter sinensis]
MKARALGLALLLLTLGAGFAVADDDGEHHGEKKYKRPKQLSVPLSAPKVWRAECGSCHIAYPPGLLPPAAWKQQMDTLKNHYGSNATLDKADEQAIRDFLAATSSVNRLALEPSAKAGEPPRISTTAWFIRKHDEVRADVWRRKSVGSAANCVACHAGAEKGDFDEDRVKIPN